MPTVCVELPAAGGGVRRLKLKPSRVQLAELRARLVRSDLARRERLVCAFLCRSYGARFPVGPHELFAMAPVHARVAAIATLIEAAELFPPIDDLA